MKLFPRYSAPFTTNRITEIQREVTTDKLELRGSGRFERFVLIYHKGTVTFKIAFDKLHLWVKVV
jgi:hypothetical protein